MTHCSVLTSFSAVRLMSVFTVGKTAEVHGAERMKDIPSTEFYLTTAHQRQDLIDR